MAQSDPMSELAADLVKETFKHHFEHARFQEHQRNWITVAYLTATGLIVTGLTRSPDLPATVLTIAPVFHLAATCICCLVTVKNSGEFRRHFAWGNRVLLNAQRRCNDADLRAMLGSTSLKQAQYSSARSSAGPDIMELMAVGNLFIFLYAVFVLADVLAFLWQRPAWWGHPVSMWSVASIAALAFAGLAMHLLRKVSARLPAEVQTDA